MEDFISQEQFQSELQAIDKTINSMKCEDILSRSNSYGLQFEVIASAFNHKEQFPKASLLECLQVGANEWDVENCEEKNPSYI